MNKIYKSLSVNRLINEGSFSLLHRIIDTFSMQIYSIFNQGLKYL